MRRWLSGSLATAVLAALLAGCGIPDDTEVRPLGSGPSAGAVAGDEQVQTPPTRTDTLDYGRFVINYLSAASGDLDVVDRAKQFLTPEAGAAFKPDANAIRVVRLTERDPLVQPGSPDVEVRARTVGTLGPHGVFDPATDDEPTTLKFTVAEVDGQSGLFLSSAPPFLVLSDAALATYYTRRTIYFWDQQHTGLVPDIRYLPNSVPRESQPTRIIDWLVNGPSPWLSGVVEGLPDDTKLMGNVPAASNGTLQINLTGMTLPSDDVQPALQRLQRQLRWSLRPNLPGTLKLSIEHVINDTFSGDDYFAANPGYRPTEPERFAVFNGQIQRLARSYNQSQPVPTVRPQDNKNVRMAALAVSGGRSFAALVVTRSRGREVLRVGAAGTGEQATLGDVTLAGPTGRPVWAKSPAEGGTHGLITAGGKLYSFRPEGGRAALVQWPGGAPGSITGVAVAPDGHRVAILAGGKLYVAGLSSGDAGLRLNLPRVIQTSLRSPTAVDWSGEGMLTVAGTGTDLARVAIMEVSIDGAEQSSVLPDRGTNPISYLASAPANPWPAEASVYAYQLGGSAYDEQSSQRLTIADLAQPPANPPADALPTAPFFLS